LEFSWNLRSPNIIYNINYMDRLPWTEKYRPIHLDDIVNHDENIKAFKNLINSNKSLINMIFYGPPGTGKTSLILAIARYLYGEKDYKKFIIEINASSDRGIDTIRTTLKDFVKIKSEKLKLVILDEIDSMTQDAQMALRGLIDTFSINNRFCLICNNIEKIIPALKSCCLPIKFTSPTNQSVKIKLNQIIEKENINICPNALNILANVDRDLRQLINILQGIHYLYSNEQITIDKINSYLGIPDEKDIINIYSILITNDFYNNYNLILDMFKSSKWTIDEFLKYIFKKLITDESIDIKNKNYIIADLSKIENRVKNSGDSEIHLAYIVSSFSANYKVN